MKVQKLDLDMKDGQVSWVSGGPGIRIKLLGNGIDLTLDLSDEMSVSLRQALSWSNPTKPKSKMVADKV